MQYSDFIAHLKTKTRLLEKENESKQEIILGLENIIQERETRINELENTISDLNKEIKRLDEANEALMHLANERCIIIEELKAEIRELKDENVDKRFKRSHKAETIETGYKY